MIEYPDKLDTVLAEVSDNFIYRKDLNGDRWRILELDEKGKYRGDCEDFSLTVLWHLNNECWLCFFWNVFVTCRDGIWFVHTRNGEGHAVGSSGSRYFDNILLKAYRKRMFKAVTRHRFKRRISRLELAYRMIKGR